MDTKANYLMIGLFVIILTAVMIFGFIWLSGMSHHNVYRIYLVYARGGVTGLNADSPVLYNGVRVGAVKKIELDKDNPQFVKLYLNIDESTPVTESTVATLIPQGITGLVYIGLKAQSPQANPLKAEKGHHYPVIPFEKPVLTQLTEALPEMTKNMSQIAERFRKLFKQQNIDNISNTLVHIENITALIDKRSKTINQSIISLNTLLKNSAQASQHFDATLTSAQRTINQLDEATSDIRMQVKYFRQQTMPSIQELINKMNDTTANLQQFSQDLSKNPAILIRGKKSAPPGPGE